MRTHINQAIKILYQDPEIVAIHKPPGLMVHRSRIDPHASEFALQRTRDQIGQLVFPIHRLDRPTSGVLLFALNQETARELAKQFETRRVKKTYHAIVRGFVDSGIWDEPLLEKPDRISDQNARPNKPPQPAVTQYEGLRRWEIPLPTGKYPNSRYSLVKIQPRTGRRHQIRRHFNHMGHPIIGDTSHGDRRHNHLFREQLGIERLLLVASSLKISHPTTAEEILIAIDFAGEFSDPIRILNSKAK